MQIQANQISRDWAILHRSRKFHVNFTDSDSQTLALLNRDNWEIWEETADGTEEFDVYIFKNSTPQQKKIAEENIRLAEELIKFCIKNWDNKFMQEICSSLSAYFNPGSHRRPRLAIFQTRCRP